MMQKYVSTNLPSDTSLPRLPGREVAAHTLDQASTDTGASMSPFSASSAGQMTVHGTVHKTCCLRSAASEQQPLVGAAWYPGRTRTACWLLA